MAMWDKKKQIDTIISRRKGVSSDAGTPMANEVVKTEDGEVEPRHVAATEVMHAFHEKSPEKMMDALSNFIDLHMNKKDEPKPEE